MPNAGEADRLIRALQRGGIARRAADGRWSIQRDTDGRGRVIGRMDAVAIDALVAMGHLCQRGEDSGSAVWTGPAPAEEPRAVQAPSTKGPRSVGAASSKRRSPLEQVLDSFVHDGDRLRARNAALRFNGDIHRAATPQPTTMRWDAAGAVDGSRGRGQAGPALGAVSAARTLSAVQKRVGQRDMAAIAALVLHQRPMARIAAEAGWPIKEAPRALGQCLLRLADAFDTCTPGFR